MSDLADLIRLQGHVKRIVEMRKQLAVLSDKDFSGMTPKAVQKNGTDRTWLCMDIDKAEREAHAAAVDCGIADPRSAESYGPVDYRPSAFHHYRHTPTLPKCRQGGTA